MGEELERQGGRYWVVYYQPLPEAGERIAAALVFADGVGRAMVEYDPEFVKVLKLFPNVDVQALAFYMRSMQSDLNDAAEPVSVLDAFGPQLAISAARRIARPLDSAKVDLLKNRYLFPEKDKKKRTREGVPNFTAELEAFVRNRAGSGVSLRTGVSARQIFGRPVTGTKKVAIAVEQATGWTLIDGVDLNKLSPHAVVNRADDIARSFWNYGRAADESGIRVRRVGIVLNGHSHLAEKTHEAHDYALHRFETESDAAIDAASTEAGQKLRQVLQNADVN